MGRRETEEQKQKHREQQRQYRAKHPDKIREAQRRYVARNADKIRKWRKNHPELAAAGAQRRREANALSRAKCDESKYHKFWTQEETEFLIENYATMSRYDLAKWTGRTIAGIERKRNRLGLKKEGNE